MKRTSSKSKVPTATQTKKKLWDECKRLVRAKYVKEDGTWSCYTCDLRIENPKDAHTAHFIASSVCGIDLRYSLENLRVCCGNCNVWKSGNWPAYYERMVLEVGQEKVDELMKRRNQITKGGVLWLQQKLEEYKKL